MPKTYAELLKEARGRIREVSATETDALRQRGLRLRPASEIIREPQPLRIAREHRTVDATRLAKLIKSANIQPD